MKHLSKILTITFLLTNILLISVPSIGQVVKFKADNSLRNNQLKHYYKMVTWDDTLYKEFAYSLENGSTIVESMNWRAVFPAGYVKNGPVKYPMIVMLHGAGESAREWTGHYSYVPTDLEFDNNGLQLKWGGKEHLDAVNRPVSNSKSFPGIVLFPQAKYNGAWSNGWNSGTLSQNNRMVVTIVEEMIRNYSVDQYQIIVHGLSNGAKGTWDIAAKRPDLFAAMLPMSGVGTDLTPMTDILVTTPLWLFQGGLDTNPSPGGANNWINTLKNKGGSPKLTLYPDLGHGVWNTAYGEAEFFPWIKAQNKKNIFVFGGITKFCTSGQSVKLGFSAGFLSYQWTYNGVDIPGATTRFYTALLKGTYTVKFTRKTDGVLDESFPVNLSDVDPSDAPLLSHTGSVKLPIQNIGSLDNIVTLIAPPGYAEYRWFKDGVKVATTSTNVRQIANGMGTTPSLAGSYTVQIAYSSICASPQSNAVVVTYTDPQPTTPAFNILTRTAVSPTTITVTWADISEETSYEIWRYRKSDYVAGTSPSGYPLQKYSLISTVPSNTTSFSDTQVRPGASYIYRIRAIMANGSVFSNAPNPTFFAPSNDNIAPTTPGTFSATNITANEVTLSWLASTDNDVVYHYEVYNDNTEIAKLISDTADADLTDGNPAPPTQYVVTGLAPATTYTFKVRSSDYRGLKPDSNRSGFQQITVTTLATSSEGRFAVESNEPTMQERPAKINVYPVPFNDKISIDFPEKAGIQNIALIDYVGLTIKSSQINTENNSITLDFSDIPPGNYILIIGNTRFRVTKN